MRKLTGEKYERMCDRWNVPILSEEEREVRKARLREMIEDADCIVRTEQFAPGKFFAHFISYHPYTMKYYISRITPNYLVELGFNVGNYGDNSNRCGYFCYDKNESSFREDLSIFLFGDINKIRSF